MSSLIPGVGCLTLAWLCSYVQAADAPSFDVASIKPASSTATGTACSGGPGTTDPGTWRCSSAPLAFLISHAYGFQPPQFAFVDSCCRARFDIIAKMPAGTTKRQFRQMLQDLLAERFKLSFHHEQKEMAIFELTVGEQNTKMKHSAPDALPAEEDPPWVIPEFSLGQDGCPVFPPGRGGLMGGGNGCYRWTGFNLSMVEIAKTLSFHLGRPVVDATGLKEKYDVDMTWSIDVTRFMEGLERAGLLDQTGEAADYGPRGPTLIHAVRDQLGLKLNSKKGLGDVVVVDHVEKVPTEN